MDKVRTFQQLVHRYRETALAAETVISDPSAISAGDAEALGRQLDRLLEWEITTIDQSLAERLSGTCSKLLNRLQEYDNHAKSELPASFADLHTLKDLDRIEAVYTLLKSKPEEIDGIDKSQLFSSSIRPFATGLLEEAERLVCERDGLSSVFAINDVCGLEELSALRKVVRQSQGRFLRSFGKEYRKAKDVLRSFAKDESIVNNRALSELLERLECFMRDERSFSQHTTYCKILGDMFKGLDTDWDRLRSVLAWTADFIEVAGPPDEAVSLAESYSKKFKPSGSDEQLLSVVAAIRTAAASYVAELMDLGTSDCFEELLFRGLSVVRKQLEEQRDACLSVSKSSIMRTLPQRGDTLAIRTAINAAIESNKLRVELDTDQEVMSLLGSHFKGVDTDIDSLMETVNWAFHIRTLHLPDEFVTKLTAQNLSVAIGEISKAAQGLSQNLGLIDSNVKRLSQFGELDMNTFYGQTPENLSIRDIEHKLTSALSEIVRLPKLADYRRFVGRAVSAGLEEMVEAIESGILPAEEACDAYLHAVYDSIARQQIRETTDLATFTRADYEARREKFAELDRQILSLYRKKIAHRARQRPVPTGQKGARVREWTEMCLLEKEFNKTRRHVPIRQLMNRAGNAIRALKPIYMMSPMSVAQFLEPGKHHFDVMIMDEASQIQPHDALGAIARASQMIVVGDSKQLPPTTFFQAEMDNPDDEQGEESIFDDTDANFSILDMCDAIRMPSTRLKWHYRSEHESLIAFSNSMWYDNELVIFPSPVTNGAKLGIVLHHVDRATYAAGKNEIEADRVAQHIIAHAKRFPELSLGVGTFNLKQRDVIEDRLDCLAREDPATELALEEFRKHHKDLEPLFIKNLENLQGDERDVIFISCTFGPDRDTGQVFQRFGPINGPNGPRRLNVLFTRAKKRMEVFSSMKHDDIITGPGLEGRIALKKFLKYAESGNLPDYGETTEHGPDSDFEVAVAKVINNIGFRTRLQVGVSGYFIDIGVYHPNRPGVVGHQS